MIRNLLLLALAVTAAGQDKTEIENAWVRVLRVKLPPHAKIAMHQHPATVAVFLSDIHAKITAADGTVRNLDSKSGEVGFNEADKHAEENVSGQPLEAVIIELKPGAPKSPPITLDPVKLDAEHHLVAFENDRVRVLRTILPPDVKSPTKLGDGRVVDNPRHPGDIAWRDALEHQTEQMGDKTAVEIQVEIK